MAQEAKAASIIFTAGYGSRMRGFSGNKTLLPLIPGSNPFEGEYPIIFEVVRNLPRGPKALVIHHKKDEVIRVTRDLGVLYYEQSVPDGTGGALIAARGFLEEIDQEYLIITMGDIPFVKEATYLRLISQLRDQDLVVLGFKPMDRAQYGILEIEGGGVKRITEWRYWKEYPLERKSHFEVCNSGIYAARRASLLKYLKKLKQRPHRVDKERDGRMIGIEEYFITDLVELMNNDGLTVGLIVADEDKEVMGIDTLEDLVLAQSIFAKRRRQVKRL
jgi:bifunctional UDP-N-acetylglucosamine pyrophosphorylase/glucosamine-1-phosphate N-acetyltransferase